MALLRAPAHATRGALSTRSRHRASVASQPKWRHLENRGGDHRRASPRSRAGRARHQRAPAWRRAQQCNRLVAVELHEVVRGSSAAKSSPTPRLLIIINYQSLKKKRQSSILAPYKSSPGARLMAVASSGMATAGHSMSRSLMLMTRPTNDIARSLSRGSARPKS